MMRFRPFENRDAAVILGWIKDEETFRKWCADRYPQYPAAPEQMIAAYRDNGDANPVYPMTAVDETGVAGHMILRYTDDDRRVVRFGFVVVDDKRRGRGLGGQMLSLATEYAARFLGAEKITLGVFENNPGAFRCYQAAGFTVQKTNAEKCYHVMGQDWKCIEMERDTAR